jgi:glycosyltransferase involved in cell wall biosynthesis
VCNEDEKTYLEQTFKSEKPVVNIPFGMSEERIALYEKYKTPAEERFQNKQVVFIGNWNLRKGSRDWPAIVSAVKKQIPNAQFLFLGTGVPEDKIRTELGVTAADSWISIIPNYTSDELPYLIKDATVGAFPSYIEGFPFAVLEKTFAGLPVIAYDVPGPREIIKQVNSAYLIPLGDTAKLSTALVDVLNYNLDTYRSLMERCIGRSHTLTCKSIAKIHEEIYLNTLNK